MSRRTICVAGFCKTSFPEFIISLPNNDATSTFTGSIFVIIIYTQKQAHAGNFEKDANYEACAAHCMTWCINWGKKSCSCFLEWNRIEHLLIIGNLNMTIWMVIVFNNRFMILFIVRGCLDVFVEALLVLRSAISHWLSLMQIRRQRSPACILLCILFSTQFSFTDK